MRSAFHCMLGVDLRPKFRTHVGLASFIVCFEKWLLPSPGTIPACQRLAIKLIDHDA
jgi:hypothetical protein